MAQVIYGHFDPRYEQSKFSTYEDYCRAALGYVGATIDKDTRLKAHIQQAQPGQNKHYHWLAMLHKAGCAPVQVIFEEVPSADSLADREDHWIAHFLDMGCRLTNKNRKGGYSRSSRRPVVRPEARPPAVVHHLESSREVATRAAAVERWAQAEVERNIIKQDFISLSGLTLLVSPYAPKHHDRTPFADDADYLNSLDAALLCKIELEESETRLELAENERHGLSAASDGNAEIGQELDLLKVEMVLQNALNRPGGWLTSPEARELAALKKDSCKLAAAAEGDRLRESRLTSYYAILDIARVFDGAYNTPHIRANTTDKRRKELTVQHEQHRRRCSASVKSGVLDVLMREISTSPIPQPRYSPNGEAIPTDLPTRIARRELDAPEAMRRYGRPHAGVS